MNPHLKPDLPEAISKMTARLLNLLQKTSSLRYRSEAHQLTILHEES
jgi:hypothetical protein